MPENPVGFELLTHRASLSHTAQLIINYHLKSVAHMPVKSLIYKTLTTVVDDFFSFCIKVRRRTF